MQRLQRSYVVARTLGLLLFAPVTTFALELGEASIKSGLGQSLLVEIPYRLAATERLTSTCISLAPASRAAEALPRYSRVSRITITPTHIEIFGDSLVREPLIGLTVDVHCATAPRFVRNYELFVDPPVRTPTLLSSGAASVAASPLASTSALSDTSATAATHALTPSSAAARTSRSNPSARARGHAGGSITQGETYRVVRGDTLSGIAARVVERPGTIRETAEAIFAANPEAFTRGNRDHIAEGRSITIPIMTSATASLPAATAPAPLPAIREAELPAVTVPAGNLPSAPSATQPTLTNDAASTIPQIQPAAAPVAVVEPSVASSPVTMTSGVAPEAPSSATDARNPSAWLAALLAVIVVMLFSAALVFVRRRKQEAAVRADTTVHESRPRRPADRLAGIEVVEGQLAGAPNDNTASTNSARGERFESEAVASADRDDVAVTIGPNDSVDLDVGAPVVLEERVDWFASRADAATVDDANGSDETIEDAATTRLPDLDAAVTARHPSPQSKGDISERTIDDQMALTIAELDLLRLDYEAEHTLTQQANKALRDALADLEATKAARAAAEAPTTELPQPTRFEPTARAPRARTK